MKRFIQINVDVTLDAGAGYGRYVRVAVVTIEQHDDVSALKTQVSDIVRRVLTDPMLDDDARAVNQIAMQLSGIYARDFTAQVDVHIVQHEARQ